MRRNAVRMFPLQCPDVSVMLSGYYRNRCPDVAEIRSYPRISSQPLGDAVYYAEPIVCLELSTNTVTHFYSEKKNTTEIVKLMDILLEKYKDYKK